MVGRSMMGEHGLTGGAYGAPFTTCRRFTILMAGDEGPAFMVVEVPANNHGNPLTRLQDLYVTNQLGLSPLRLLRLYKTQAPITALSRVHCHLSKCRLRLTRWVSALRQE